MAVRVIFSSWDIDTSVSSSPPITGNYEIGETDGTPGGTVVPLKDIMSGTHSDGFGTIGNNSNATAFSRLGNNVVFFANDGTHGQELWVTDGTSGGTQLLKDINPGSAASSGTDPTSANQFSAPVVFNGYAYFSATDGTHGNELWRTDGTAAGTTLVKDINTGANGSNPGAFLVAGNQLYFSATDSTHGLELWKTDGTTTSMVADLNVGAGGSSATPSAALNGN